MNNQDKNTVNNSAEDAQKAASAVLRKCCACGKIANRKELVRILKDYKSGEYIINPTNKQFGRSFYICKNAECLRLAAKKKRLKSLSENRIEELSKIING